MRKSIKEVKCKRCGGNNFCVSVFYQSSKDYRVLSNGKLSKKYTKQGDMPMECNSLYCADCGEAIDCWHMDKANNIEIEE